MTSATLPGSPRALACAALLRAPSGGTDALGERIAAMASRLHAATYQLLVLLAEFDAREGWKNGFLSCAHWLHWRTGIDLGAAREKVRVARALPALLLVSDRMRRGHLSYAKVRALTRVATPDNEHALVDLALAGTAAHVERFVRAWRRVDDAGAARETEKRHLSRQLSTWVDDDGMVVIRGRLTPEIGAVVQRALEAGADRLFREGRATSTGNGMAEEVTPAQRRADALGLLAETALSADLDAGTSGDRYQVVLHVDTAAALGRSPEGGGPDGHTPFEGTLELDHGPTYVSTETSRRLACDASVVRIDHDAGGGVLDVGRRTRTIPPSTRRALAARDTGCCFPGCTSRRCDAHHIEHWADGGVTSLGNLLLLCRRHHRAVHEGGFGVFRQASGQWLFHRPDGQVIPAVPDSEALVGQWPDDVTPDVASIPVWDGAPFDVAWAIDVLHDGRGVLKRKSDEEERCGSLWARCPAERARARRPQLAASAATSSVPETTLSAGLDPGSTVTAAWLWCRWRLPTPWVAAPRCVQPTAARLRRHARPGPWLDVRFPRKRRDAWRATPRSFAAATMPAVDSCPRHSTSHRVRPEAVTRVAPDGAAPLGTEPSLVPPALGRASSGVVRRQDPPPGPPGMGHADRTASAWRHVANRPRCRGRRLSWRVDTPFVRRR